MTVKIKGNLKANNFTIKRGLNSKATSWFEGFESGNFGFEWIVTDDFSITSDSSLVFNGTYAGRAKNDSGTTQKYDLATATPDVIYGGTQISYFEFYYFERDIIDHYGGGIRLLSNSGDEVLAVSASSSQWRIKDNNGWEEVDSQSSNEDWHYVKITFDWNNLAADVYWEDTVNNRSNTYSNRPLINNNTNIGKLAIRNYNIPRAGGYNIDMIFDNLKIEK